MLFKRAQITSIGQEVPVRSMSAAGIMDMLNISQNAVDANATLDVASISGGGVQYTNFTAGRTLTTATAAQYLASAPDMDIGDSFTILVSIVSAFAGTLAAGTGVTLLGKAAVPASGLAYLVFTRTGAAAMSCRVL